jgi:hypothetical protein
LRSRSTGTGRIDRRRSDAVQRVKGQRTLAAPSA